MNRFQSCFKYSIHHVLKISILFTLFFTVVNKKIGIPILKIADSSSAFGSEQSICQPKDKEFSDGAIAMLYVPISEKL